MVDFNPTRKHYYRQLNAKLNPRVVCQTVTAAELIAICGYVEKLVGAYEYPADNLYAYCSSEDIQEYAALEYGKDWQTKTTHASLLPKVLAKAINDMVGFVLAVYDTQFTWEKVIANLYAGKPMTGVIFMHGMQWPVHWVCIVGVTDNDELIVDDPLKNYLLDAHDGYHCLYSQAQWTKYSKGYGLLFNGSR